MNLFRKPRRAPAAEEQRPPREWSGEPEAPRLPLPFVEDDFEDDEFEGEGWRFWGD